MQTGSEMLKMVFIRVVIFFFLLRFGLSLRLSTNEVITLGLIQYENLYENETFVDLRVFCSTNHLNPTDADYDDSIGSDLPVKFDAI